MADPATADERSLGTGVCYSFQTVHFSPLFGGDASMTAILDAAAAAGWTSVGLDHATVNAHLAAGGELDGLPKLLAERGLDCSDVVALAIAADRKTNLQQAHLLAEIARSTGARICVAAFVEPVDTDPTPDLRTLTARLAAGADVIDAAGSRIALELLPYSPVSDPSTALQICESLGLDRAGLLIDSWHVFAGGHLDDCRGLSADAIAMVQFADGVDIRTCSGG